MSSRPDPEDLGFELPAAAKTSRGVVAAVLVAIVVGAGAIGYIQHRGGIGAGSNSAPVAHGEGAAAIARVEVFAPKPLQSDQALVLPGVVRPLEETKIFPRT